MKKVAVLGGGVGGMTAAHELIVRGFQVVVFEQNDIAGGKARSMPYKGSLVAGKNPFPGEHGFRFFPGFYRHLPDTLARIDPSLLGHLTGTQNFEVARMDKPGILLPAHLPLSPIDLYQNLVNFFTADWDLPAKDAAFFADRLLVLLTTCEERRFAEYEGKSWWDFSEAASRSEQYQKYCAEGLTRTLVAARAQKISTRTAGYILLQLLFDLATPGVQMDRVLNGPTNDVWIDPWLQYLVSLGVDYRMNAKVVGFNCVGTQIASVTVEENGQAKQEQADYYVAALPAEKMRDLVTNTMIGADPTLLGLNKLDFGWMNGIQFYVKKSVGNAVGHTLYVDSKWALTSIAQKQFWPNVDLAQHGNGTAVDVLSVDVSEWEEPGNFLPHTAHGSTHAEIVAEVLEQLKAHLNTASSKLIDNSDVVDQHLDPAIVFQGGVASANLEQLLVNAKGSWSHRPGAVTAIGNLFLAADYVRTFTDLATMESANEAARRAVNGILAAENSSEARCKIWPLKESAWFAPLRLADWFRFKLDLPHARLAVSFGRALTLPWQVTHAAARAFWRLRAAVSRSGLRGRIPSSGRRSR